MEKKIKKYKVTKDDSMIYGLSVVSEPAIESNFLMFSKDDKEIKSSVVCLKSEEKHNIIGCALRPDFPIYRRIGEEEFYIEFDKDCIEKLAHEFVGNGSSLNLTKDHESPCENLSVVESWIVEDVEHDKATHYGLDVELGSWVVMCHCDSISLWESFKKGERNGFSIESWVKLEEIITDKDNNISMNKNVKLEEAVIDDNFWSKLKSIITDALNGSSDDDTPEEVAEEIVEKAEEVAEEVPATEENLEEETPAEVADEVAEEVIEVVEEAAETPEEATEDLQHVVDTLNEEIEALKAENEELKKQNMKMSKMPSTKVVNKQSADNKNPRDIIEAIYNGTYFK